MLAYFRENAGNWIFKILLGIIVIVFVFLGVGSMGSKQGDMVASIDDEPISFNEYKQAYENIINQLKIQFGENLNDDIIKALNVKQQALNAIIDSRLLLAQADELGIFVSDKELQQSILNFKAFQKNGKFDLEQYKTVLRMNSLTPEMFEKNQVNTIRQEKVRQMVTNNVQVSDLEARNWFLFQNNKTAVDYLRFDPSSYKDIPVEEKIIQEFYQENKEQYLSEPKIKVAYLKFDPKDYTGKVKIATERLKEYYQENSRLFETPEKVEARHILIKTDSTFDEKQIAQALQQAKDVYQKAIKDEDFAELAKKYSQGPSGKDGGYLGSFDRQSMVKPFAEKAFSMKAGEISEPVKTQFGWHIIKVESRSSASKESFETVKEQIQKDLEKEELQNLAYNDADEAFEAVIDGDNFEQVARIVSKKTITTPAFSRDGQGLSMGDKSGFAQAAFELRPGYISDVKQLGEAYYIMQVVDTIEPDQLELEKVEGQIRNQILANLRLEKAKEQAQEAVEQIKDGATLSSVAKIKKMDIKTTKLFTRNSSIEGIGNSPAFIQAAFSLNADNKNFPEIIETASGFYVISFNKSDTPDENTISKNLENLKNQLALTKQNQAFQAWLVEIKKQHNIEYDPRLIQL